METGREFCDVFNVLLLAPVSAAGTRMARVGKSAAARMNGRLWLMVSETYELQYHPCEAEGWTGAVTDHAFPGNLHHQIPNLC